MFVMCSNSLFPFSLQDIESPGCIQKKQVLYIKMKNPVNKLLTFCPKSEQSRLVKIEFVSPNILFLPLYGSKLPL